MLHKGDGEDVSDIAELMYSKMDRNESLIFSRIGGSGEEFGEVTSVGLDKVIVSVLGNIETVLFCDIIDFR